MKIKDLLQNKKVTVSFEVFPPKENAPFEPVISAVDKLSIHKPDYISVTYGAGGGVSTKTVDIATHIQKELSITALAHLTCVSSTKDDVSNVLNQLKANKIENILALRGDIPQGVDFPQPMHYQYAYQLINDIKSYGDFSIGAACYPEGHIECDNKENDIAYLKEKVDAGCDFLVTQLFFDNNVLYNFLYRLFQKNINVPIVAGVMPVTNSRQIKRMTALSGATLTPKYKAMLDRFADNPEALMQAGILYASEQIVDLISNGVKGIHIYTMNKPEIAEGIMKNISQAIK